MSRARGRLPKGDRSMACSGPRREALGKACQDGVTRVRRGARDTGR